MTQKESATLETDSEEKCRKKLKFFEQMKGL